MANQSATKNFIDWMYSIRYEDLPSDVRKTVQLALYDGIGNIMACSLLPIAHRLFNFIRLTGDSSNSTVIGFPSVRRLSTQLWSTAHWGTLMRSTPSMTLIPGAIMSLPLAWAQR